MLEQLPATRLVASQHRLRQGSCLSLEITIGLEFVAPYRLFQLCHHAVANLRGRLHGERDRQHLLRFLDAVVGQQLQVALNQQSGLAGARRGLHNPRLLNVERSLALLPIRQSPVVHNLRRARRTWHSKEIGKQISHGLPPWSGRYLRPHRAAIHPIDKGFSGRIARTSSDICSARLGRRRKQNPPLAVPIRAASRSPAPQGSLFSSLPTLAARSYSWRIPSTPCLRLPAPAQTRRLVICPDRTGSHTEEAAAHRADPSASRSAKRTLSCSR